MSHRVLHVGVAGRGEQEDGEGALEDGGRRHLEVVVGRELGRLPALERRVEDVALMHHRSVPDAKERMVKICDKSCITLFLLTSA